MTADDSRNDEPEPDDPPITDRAAAAVNARGDYLSESVDEHSNVPIRWTKKMPLTVYFHPVDQDVHSYRPKMRLLMHTALASWSKKSGNAVRFKVVETLPADIEIAYRDSPPEDSSGTCDTVGLTRTRHSDIKLTRQRVFICVPLNSSDQYVLSVSEHEIGHALGLNAHSPVSDDVMFATVVGDGTTISPKDARTVRRLYESTMGSHKNDPKFDQKLYRKIWTDFTAENFCLHEHSVHNTCKLRIAVNNTGRMFRHEILEGDDYGEAILAGLNRINYFPPPDLATGDWLQLTLDVSKDHVIAISKLNVMHEHIPSPASEK